MRSSLEAQAYGLLFEARAKLTEALQLYTLVQEQAFMVGSSSVLMKDFRTSTIR